MHDSMQLITKITVLYRSPDARLKTVKMLKNRIAKKSKNKISFHIHNNHFNPFTVGIF